MSEVIEFRKRTVPQLAGELVEKLDQRNKARISRDNLAIARLDPAEERRLETKRGDGLIVDAIKHIINQGEGLDAAVTCMSRRLQELKASRGE